MSLTEKYSASLVSVPICFYTNGASTFLAAAAEFLRPHDISEAIYKYYNAMILVVNTLIKSAFEPSFSSLFFFTKKC